MFYDEIIKSKRIHYFRIGNGKPILFVHGWGGSTASLLPLAKLISKNHTVIGIDLPGFGKSSLPNPNWGVAEYAKLIMQFMDKTGFNKFHYFGHSFGGSLGIYLAAQKNNHIDKLFLCASSYKRSPQKTSLLRNANFIPLPISIRTQLKRIMYRIFFPHSDSMKYPLLESNFRKIIQTDLTPLISQIKNKTYIYWGEEDTQTPISLAHELHTRIEHSHLFVYKRQGHSLPILSPHLIFRQLKNQL